MKKSFRSLVLACLGASVVLGSINTSEAGVIPWAYDAIFGPVGSLRNSSGAFLAYRPFQARRLSRRYGNMGYYPGTICQPACNTGCNTSQYQAGYYPGYSSYYGQAGCSSCYSGCSSCTQGCASGNCSSGTTPAMGTTSAPTPAASNPAPTPTTTFKSTAPEIKPEATKKSGTGGKSNSNYDEKNPAPDVFSLPKQPEVKETKPEAKTNAPMFNDNGFGLPPVGKKTEAKKVPLAPLLPVEQHKPAPTEIEENSGIKLPSLPLVPAPIEIDDSKITFMQAPQRTRIARTAYFHVPQVARYVPSMNDSLIPPLPTPVHLAGK